MLYLNDFENSSLVDKASYEAVEKDLQERLYILFSESSRQKIPIIVVLEGWAGSGKGDVIKSITTRLDPRKIRVYSTDETRIDNRKFPLLYDYWRKLPSFNESAIFNGSWYYKVSHDRVNKIMKKESFRASFRSITNFEETLVADRYVIYKYFLHISQKEQKKRLKKAKEENKKWLVSSIDWHESERYYEYQDIFEEFLNRTNFVKSPWTIVPAKDKFYTRLNILESLIERLEAKLGIDSRQLLEVLKQESVAL